MCFGESVVGVYFGAGYGVTVNRFVLINIRTDWTFLCHRRGHCNTVVILLNACKHGVAADLFI